MSAMSKYSVLINFTFSDKESDKYLRNSICIH
jgi:hypothetical protein